MKVFSISPSADATECSLGQYRGKRGKKLSTQSSSSCSAADIMIEDLACLGISSEVWMEEVHLVTQDSTSDLVNKRDSPIGIHSLDNPHVCEGIVHSTVFIPVMGVVEKHQVSDVWHFVPVKKTSLFGKTVQERHSSFTWITFGKVGPHLHPGRLKGRENETGAVFSESAFTESVPGMSHEIPGRFCKSEPATFFQVASGQRGMGYDPGGNPTFAPIEQGVSESFGTSLLQMFTWFNEKVSRRDTYSRPNLISHGAKYWMPETISNCGRCIDSCTGTCEKKGRDSEKNWIFHGDLPPEPMISKM